MRHYLGWLALALGCQCLAGLTMVPYGPGKVESLSQGQVRVAFRPDQLSGAQFNVEVEPGDYELVVTLKLSGQGRVYGGLCERGWRFTPWWKPGEAFQTFRSRFHVSGGLVTLALFGAEGAREAVVSDMRLEKLNLVPLQPVAIPGTAWDARDYVGKNASVVEEGVRVKDMHQQLVRLPLPRTSLPLYLILRGRCPGKLQLMSCNKVLGIMKPEGTAMRGGPIRYGDTDGTVTVVMAENVAEPYVVSDGLFSTRTDAALPVSPSFWKNGVATAARVTGTLTLDGKGRDSHWKGTVPLSDFRVANGTSAAKERTTLRMLWDESKLYLQFRGTSYSLKRLSNDFGSFRKSVMEPDNDGIYYDDCFVFVLHDPRQKRVFDVVVNANRTLMDSRMTEVNPWSNRELTWSSGATVRTSLQEGEWIAELGIPWKNLGIQPKQGMELRFCAGRMDGKQRESSTWQPTKAGYHDPSEYSVLRLEGTVPGVRAVTLPAFDGGVPRLKITMAGGAAAVIEQHSPRGWREELVRGTTALKPMDELLPTWYSYAVMDPVSRRCLLRTPALRPSAGSVKISLPVASGVRGYLNGLTMTRGTGSLMKGLNVLAVHCAGAMPGVTVSGQAEGLPGVWRYSPTAPDGWQAAEFDDRSWQMTEKADKAGFYRKQLVLKGTVIWPFWQRKCVHIPAGMTQMMDLAPMGLPGVKTPQGYRVVFDLSGNLELLGATGCYGLNPCRVTTQTAPAGRRRYAVELPYVKAYSKDLPSAYQMVKLFFRATDEATGTGWIRYHSETPDRRVAELTQEIPVTILPPLRAGRMKNMDFRLWMSHEEIMNDHELLEKVMRSLFGAGFTELPAPAVKSQAEAKAWLDRGLPGHYFVVTFMGSWGLMFDQYLKKHPQWKAVNGDGVADAQFCCPQFFKSAEGRKVFAEAFKTWHARKGHARHIQWDYEESVWSSRFTCYCERCRKAFATDFKLPRVPKSKEDIRAHWSREWVTFNCRRFAMEAGLMHDQCKAVGAMFSIYSGYQSEFARTNYGVDWRLLAPHVDFAMVGYGVTGRGLDTTKEALNGKPLVNSLILVPHSRSSQDYPSVITMAKIIQTVVDGTGNGTMFYHYPTLDGRTFTAVADASRELASYERYFLARKRVRAWACKGPVQTCFLGDGVGQLGIFLNLGKGDARVEVTLPSGKVERHEIKAGQALFIEHK